MKFKENQSISKHLLNSFIVYVANDEYWEEPKRIFSSKKDFSSFPFKNKIDIHSYYEYNDENKVISFRILRDIEFIPRGKKIEAHITLDPKTWEIVLNFREGNTKALKEI